MVYQWKKAAYIKADANVAGQMCEQLERTVGLTAQNLLDANRPEDAPLHSEFEWNDSEAAELYREQQARHIINCLCIKAEEGTEEPVRAFFRVSKPEYESLSVILSNAEKHSSLLDMAYKELKAFRTKYNTLKQLQPVFDAIEEVVA